MSDAVIRADAVQNAPAGYTVPGAQEILVKSVRAVVDGSGAGSSFDAVLQLIDPAGNVVWQAPTDTTIAAGGSADVSWFPRVGGGAGSSSTVTAAASMSVFDTTPHTFVGNVGFSATWAHFNTTDTTVFGTQVFGSTARPPHNTAGDVNILLLQPGAYVIEATAVWANATADMLGQIQVLSGDYFGARQPTMDDQLHTNTPAANIEGNYMTLDTMLLTTTQGGSNGAVYLLLEGATAGNYTVNSWGVVAHWLGSGIGTDHAVY